MKRSFARSPYLWAMLGFAAVVTAAWVGRENYRPVITGSVAPDFEVMAMDGSFDAPEFIAGARGAFEMIVEAFAKGDRDSLQALVNAEVYSNFVTAIAAAVLQRFLYRRLAGWETA